MANYEDILREEKEAVNKRIKVLEEKNREAVKSLEHFEKMSMREQLAADKWHKERIVGMHKEAFEKLIKREYPSMKNREKELFEEYFELMLDEKVKNMIEFLKSKNGTN